MGLFLSVTKLHVYLVLFQYIFIVHVMNFIHTFTYPLLWWWYDDNIACFMFIFLQNCLTLPKIKLPPVSDIIFFGKPYSDKIIVHATTKLSADRSSAFLIGNL